jgi:predicted acetyltransferase
MSSGLQLIAPDQAHLPSYAAALRTGWSPNNLHDVSAAHLAEIEANPDMFLTDLLALHGTVTLPDGSVRQRLPQILRWMWDGAFAGTISLRWQPGSNALPPHVPGHIGYAVVPWKRRKGYATEALRMMLTEAKAVGLSSIEITTDTTNEPSQRVIEHCGGVHFATRDNPIGGVPKRHYRIGLTS